MPPGAWSDDAAYLIRMDRLDLARRNRDIVFDNSCRQAGHSDLIVKQGEMMLVTTAMKFLDTKSPVTSASFAGSWYARQGLARISWGGLKQIVGGNIEAYARVCEAARKEAFERMLLHVQEHGADAVIGMRYDATEFTQGVTDVLAYGTAVKLSRDDSNV